MSFLAGHPPLDQGFHSHDSHRFLVVACSAVAILMAGLLSRAGLQSLERMHEIQEDSLQTPSLVMEAPVGSIRLNHTEVQNLVKQSASEVATMNRESQRIANKQIQFAHSETRAYENLLTDLKERLSHETSPVNVSKMKMEIANLEDRVADTKMALHALSLNSAAKRNPFMREDLHGSLLAMQDAGHRAVSVFVNGDANSNAGTDSDDGTTIDSQMLRVSRTGQ